MLKAILFGLAVFFLYITFTQHMAKPAKAMIRTLMVLCILMIATACSGGSTAPQGPKYTYGPGCTMYISSPVGPNGWSDIIAIRYDVCPRVVMDSTLVP